MLHGQNILIVEDEPILAQHMAECLMEAGAAVQIAGSLSAAMSVMGRSWSAAVVDHQLQAETADDIYVELKRRAVPFIIVTGHAPGLILMPDTLIFTKPVQLDRVISVIAALTLDATPVSRTAAL